MYVLVWCDGIDGIECGKDIEFEVVIYVEIVICFVWVFLGDVEYGMVLFYQVVDQ